jgi:hypothetical protein
MKKTLIAAALLALASTAFALDVGVIGGTDYLGHVGQDRGFAGVTVGQKFGNFGVIGAAERSTATFEQNRYSITGSYDLVKLGPVTFAAKAGAAYIDNRNANTNGWVGQVGVGAVVPVAGKLAATIDYRVQAGQASTNKFDGNTVTAGLQYSF